MNLKCFILSACVVSVITLTHLFNPAFRTTLADFVDDAVFEQYFDDTNTTDGVIDQSHRPLIKNRMGETPDASLHKNKNIGQVNEANDHDVAGTSSPYAYVFMMFGVDPGDGGAKNDRAAYKPYLADILISAELFHRFGSTADIVALVSLVEGHASLPSGDARLLKEMGVKVRYFSPIVPNNYGRFEVSNLNKIEILRLTEYRRVLFMDCDVIPLANLDSYFSMSETGLLKPNMILATMNVPMIGGLFMIEPIAEGFDTARQLVQKRIDRKKFNRDTGWGSEIPRELPAHQNRGGKGLIKWSFSAADGDQGFFYHYTRFIRRNVTQVLANRLIHYGPGPNGTTIIERIDKVNQKRNPFKGNTTRPFAFPGPTCRKQGSCLAGPYGDTAHFMGKRDIAAKPWMTSNPEQYRRGDRLPRSAMHLWWKTLFELEDRLGFNYTRKWLQERSTPRTS